MKDVSQGLPKSEIESALKDDKAWSIVKKNGAALIPKGDATMRFNKLIEMLDEKGIFVVREGEAENFCRELGKHGPKFVARLLETVSLDDASLQDLRDYVRRLTLSHPSG